MDSYVKIADKVCPICGVVHQHNAEILLDKRCRDIKTDDNGNCITGYSLCENHTKLHEEGYLALIVILNPVGDIVHMDEAVRTGEMIHIKRGALTELTGSDAPPEDVSMVFIDKVFYDQMVNFDQEHTQTRH
jgi:hypothetical protein